MKKPCICLDGDAVKEVYDWDSNICNMSPDFRLKYKYEIWFQDMALASSD